MNYLADILSYSSLFCGFLCVVLSLEGHIVLACWLILLAVIFDGLDGQIARLNRVPSEYGKELDSLIDVVSFGMAPAILAYIFIYRDFYVLSVLSLFIYLLACVVRLARYNITTKHNSVNCFAGLPTTVGGGMLVAFVLMSIRSGRANLPHYSPFLFLGMVLILSYLMVSRIRYLNLDGLRLFLGKRLNLAVVLFIAAFLACALLRKTGAFVFGAFLIYLLFSPFVVKRLDSKSSPIRM